MIICNFEIVRNMSLLIDYDTINRGISGSDTQWKKSKLGEKCIDLTVSYRGCAS